ncbi:hypothetical protein DXG01_001447 [Tephrocybe rancida]|nr:hypothetical protein DXG01_001447 [Tephrocybe rancida]
MAGDEVGPVEMSLEDSSNSTDVVDGDQTVFVNAATWPAGRGAWRGIHRVPFGGPGFQAKAEGETVLIRPVEKGKYCHNQAATNTKFLSSSSTTTRRATISDITISLDSLALCGSPLFSLLRRHAFSMTVISPAPAPTKAKLKRYEFYRDILGSPKYVVGTYGRSE